MRISEAGLALITRPGPDGTTEYLTQWSDSWHMYALIGGHVEAGESFRTCCVREVSEELELTPDIDFRVAPDPVMPLREYTAISKAAGVPTLYRVELYATELVTDEARKKVDARPENRWLLLSEIRKMFTVDGKPISAQVKTVLELFGVIAHDNESK